MGVTNNGALHYESGQTYYAFEEMTDSGDQTTFEASFAPMSGRSGYETAVRPYGLVTGGAVTVGAGNDNVAVAALTAYMPGNAGADADGLVTVAADATNAVTRAVTANTHIINSITIDSAGAIVVIQGTDSTAFSETRGAAGGPPYIPVGSIEIAQVRTTSFTAAAILASEIFAVPGTHVERSDFPIHTVTESAGEITFAAALPLIHTGDLPKKVYVKGYTPIFAEIVNASDYVPAETSHSTSSTDTYSGPIGSTAQSIGQGSFSARLKDGITDEIMPLKNEKLWFKWLQDRNKTPYQLTLGILGVSRTYPVGDHTVGAFTISAEKPSVDFAS